ncbi:patatin-like phospholipase family protein (plasmid) [Croceibacterium sp. TMG7-5b_MA50]|uniref:patatin-like phospholipase family protein n=1 Tax=Croceibacterium sp. TMG7-5b_MA50 TaxID=3121290 RepID=UPI003221C515
MSGKLAVVLSGGGAKGAFQVGALEALIHDRGVRPDIVVGTSTGAIQALGVAQDDVAGLRDIWLGLDGNGDIYRQRGGPLLAALTSKKGLYDTAPLRALLRRFARPDRLSASPVDLHLGVVSLKTGQFRTIDKGAAAHIADWVYASCAMPVFFDPLEDAGGEQWVDGGVTDVTPLGAALALNPTGVLVIRASPTAKAAGTKHYGGLLPIAQRAVDLLQAEVSRNDLANTALINDILAARGAMLPLLMAEGLSGSQIAAVLAPLDRQIAQYRFARISVIEPDRNYSDTLEFDPAKIRAGMAAGRRAVDEQWDAIRQVLP